MGAMKDIAAHVIDNAVSDPRLDFATPTAESLRVADLFGPYRNTVEKRRAAVALDRAEDDLDIVNRRIDVRDAAAVQRRAEAAVRLGLL